MRNRLSPVIRCLRSLCFLVIWVEIYSSSMGLEFVGEDKGDGINNILTRNSFFLGISKYSAGDQSLFHFPCWGHLCTIDGILKNSDKSQSQNVMQHCYIPLLFSCFSWIILITKSGKVPFSTHFFSAILPLAIDSPSNQSVALTVTVCWLLAWVWEGEW